jgi:hypothetical protein
VITQAEGLGPTIRTWRDRLSPAATGLPARRGRRAPGLRREELAQLAPPADGQVSGHIPPGVQRVLARLGDAAVAVFAADWQLIWWNRSWTGLFGDPSAVPVSQRNFARDTFPVGASGPQLTQWPVVSLDAEVTEAAIVSDLRRATGRFPRDRGLAALVHELTAGNQRFARLWATGTVSARS